MNNNYIFNSDLPVDQVVYFKEITMTGTSLTIPHGFGEPLLIWGVYSTSSSWSNTHSLGDGMTTTFSCNSSAISVTQYTGATIYLRFYGFLKPGSTLASSPTSTSAKNYIFNSDYNYLGLFAETTLSMNSTFYHNLGYMPFIMAWVEEYYQPGVITPISSILLSPDPGQGLKVDAQKINFFGDSQYAANTKAYVRIYANK